MADHPPEIIIIKRRVVHEEEHHGGAWKIAFADFMTAMMAFFLVLWIVTATDKDSKLVIARYFNPVKMEQSAKTPKNIRVEGPSPSLNAPQKQDPHAKDLVDAPSDAPDGGNPPPPATGDKTKLGSGVTQTNDPANPKPSMTEGVLFADPYRNLDAIAGPGAPDLHVVAQADKPKDPDAAADQEAFHDPFRQIGREVPSDALTAAEKPAPKPGSAPTAPATPSGSQPRPDASSQAEEKTMTPPPGDAKPTPVAAKPAAATPPAEAKPATPPAATANPAQPDAQKASAAARLEKELQSQIAGPGSPRVGPAIDVKATSEGLLISLTDNLNYSMFPVGSAEPQRQVIVAMDAIARLVKDRTGPIVVRGHTDARPYRSATYDNWRLSSARAQMAYYMLTSRRNSRKPV